MIFLLSAGEGKRKREGERPILPIAGGKKARGKGGTRARCGCRSGPDRPSGGETGRKRGGENESIPLQHITNKHFDSGDYPQPGAGGKGGGGRIEP